MFRYAALFLVLMSMATSAVAEDRCKDKVDQAFSKLRDGGKFRLETTITNEKGKLRMEVDYILPDRMHQRVWMSGSTAPMEMIVIGKQAWSNQGQGWRELPEKFSAAVADQIRKTVAKPSGTMTNFECMGKKEFEGQTYDAYKGVLATPLKADAEKKGPRIEALEIPRQQLVYVDQKTGLPARNIVFPVTDPKQRLFDGAFKLDSDIRIEAPKEG